MNVLFVTHETSRTGSPKVLLLFMTWLKENKPDLAIDVLALNGGEIEERFIELAQNYYNFNELTHPKLIKFFQRQLFRLKLIKRPNPKAIFFEKLKLNKYDIIYANSYPSLSIAVELKLFFMSSKLLLHLHELQLEILRNHQVKTTDLYHVDRFIAVSEKVRDNLISNLNQCAQKIDLVYEFSNEQRLLPKATSAEFVIGGSGVVDLRKGTDLFIQVAQRLFEKIPKANIKFKWAGKYSHELFLQEDIIKLGLTDRIEFLGELDDTSDFFNQIDVFLMTSREDPFPLVCIEAAMLKKPIICFARATGTAEILKNGGGHIVPYLNTQEMCEKTLFYYFNESQKTHDGELACELFSNFTPEKMCPKIYTSILTLLPK